MRVFSRSHICCAVPLYNSGIYAIMVQFFVIALLAGILSFASPPIIALSVPSFASYILGAVCMLIAAVQVLGFFGVYRERPSLYKLYSRVNALLIVIALIMALVFIIVSAVQHSQTQLRCESAFSSQGAFGSSTIAGTTTTLNTGSTSSGNAICNVWMWIQVGVMGLLLLILAVVESYFLAYTAVYAAEQAVDHAKYEEVFTSAAEELRQSGLWESTSLGARPSESLDDTTLVPLEAGGGYSSSSRLAHNRTGSNLRNEYSDKDPEISAPHDDPLAGNRPQYTEDPFVPPGGGGYPTQDGYGGSAPYGFAGSSSYPGQLVDAPYQRPSDSQGPSYEGAYGGHQHQHTQPVPGWDPKYHEV